MAKAAAGFYDDGQGRMRYFDGKQWTEQYQEGDSGQIAAPSAVKDPNVLWEAVGQPITGIGAGRYKLTRQMLYFEKGALSLSAQQVPVHEIHDVDAAQTMTQKMRGVGDITLTAVRAAGHERIVLLDIADFRNGVMLINQAAHEARDELRVKQNTTQVNYAGQAPQGPAAPAPAVGVDLNAELAKLAAFRADGILDDEEFKAAKRKLLGL